MTKNIYALLVGIDTYHPVSVPAISSLKGCVNDIKAVKAYLRERTKADEWKLVEPSNLPWILTNEKATRQAIINSFEQHLCKPDQASSPKRALQVVQRLEHIARWTNTLELESPARTRIKPDDLKMEIVLNTSIASSDAPNVATGSLSEASDIRRLEYEYSNGAWSPPTFYVRLTNNSKKTLYCNVLDLTESFAVSVAFFQDRTSMRLQPGETIEREYIDSVVPDELWEQGITEPKDRLKLIVSTTEFDASLLEQDALDLPRFTQSQRSIETEELQHQGMLNSLMALHQKPRNLSLNN